MAASLLKLVRPRSARRRNFFTTKSTARRSRNQNRTKHYHHEGREEHEVKKLKCNNFPILRVLRALRGDMVFYLLIQQFGIGKKFAQAAKTLTIVIRAFSQTSQGKRGSPVGEQPQPKAELSPAKAPRRKVDEPMPVIPSECEGSKKRLFRVFCEEVFTTEAPSSQRSENFSIKNSLLRVLRASAVQSPSPASQECLKPKKRFLPAVEMTSLPDLASLRLCGRHIRNPRVFDHRKICAG